MLPFAQARYKKIKTFLSTAQWTQIKKKQINRWVEKLSKYFEEELKVKLEQDMFTIDGGFEKVVAIGNGWLQNENIRNGMSAMADICLIVVDVFALSRLSIFPFSTEGIFEITKCVQQVMCKSRKWVRTSTANRRASHHLVHFC